MSNMVERSSIAFKVRNLSKIRSFSSRYKKKQFFDVLSYQKFHKLQKFQDRELKRLELLHEVLKKNEEICNEELKDDSKIENYQDEDESSEEEEDFDSSSDYISESEDEMEALEEEEYIDSDEYENMEEEYDSDENLGEGEEEDKFLSEEVENPAETEQVESNEGNALVYYDSTDAENSVNEEVNEKQNAPDLESNGNLILENLNEISNIDELNVSVMEDDDVEALMAMQFRDTRLQSHIREHNLNLIPRDATRNDGNCWYDAIADQIVLHELPDKPTNHVDLRLAVCDAIPKLPQAQEWIQNIFGNEETFLDFLEEHKTIGTWTDSLGIMCQATALYVERNIHIVGTANIGQGFAFTKLESVEESDGFPPFTVGYYQDRHYQSLQERPQESYEVPQKELDVSVNSDHVRNMIDEERLLDESVFESDSDFDEVYQSDDDLDSFDNNFINSDDSLSEMLKKVDKIREVKKDDTIVVEPTVKMTYGKSRNLLNRLF